MTSIYYIKVYYTKSKQSEPEIRLIAIDMASLGDAYQELCTKIALFSSDKQLNNFTLQYNDEENERITFSSNDELRSAVALNKVGNTLKVFVVAAQSITQQEQQGATVNKEHHQGIICDGCQGAVIGFRYKCLVCDNYDLCEKCSASGIHSEHNMIKITKPGSFPRRNGTLLPPPSPHRYRHYHNSHFHVRRSHHRSPPSFVPNNDFIGQIQAQIPQWLPNVDGAAHFRAHMKQHVDTIKHNTQPHMKNSKEYLESVGQYLQQALSPLGIDCDYRVDGLPPTTTEQIPTVIEQKDEQQSSPTETLPILNADVQPNDLILTNNDAERKVFSYVTMSSVEETNETIDKPSNPIEDCIERMKAMGFTEANGALYELVRAKKGDINLVLDAINPRHH